MCILLTDSHDGFAEEEEEAVIVENKWRDPYSYGNYIKPREPPPPPIRIINAVGAWG